MSRAVVRRGARATGVFGSAFGFTVFLVFLLFAVQLLFGLYVRTTVTAEAADLARRAAHEGADRLDEARLLAYGEQARSRLGSYADDAVFDFSLLDADADGRHDTVVVHVDADLPNLLPSRLVPASPTRFQRSMRARIEEFQEVAA